MKNNETGEFELVMGNRQLLTGFLIVVLLFGVAFAMGYIVGRNSTPSAKLQAEAASAANAAGKDARPQPAPPVQPDATPPADQSAPPAADQAPAQPATDAAATQPVTQPAAQPVTQPAPAPPPAVTPPAKETPPAAAPEPPAVAAPAAAAPVTEAPPGSYWQVIATANRTSADALLKGLKDKGFPVTLSPGPNNLVRVLVGPYTDTQSMGRAKTRLEDEGFHPVRK